MRRSLTFILAICLTTVTLAPTAIAREERAAYTTGADVAASCSDELAGGLLGSNVGSVCFDVRDGETQVGVELDDVYLQDVGGAISFKDENGNAIGDPVNFCGSIGLEEGLAMPEDTASIEVFVNGPTFQTLNCGNVGTATVGDVFVTFS